MKAVEKKDIIFEKETAYGKLQVVDTVYDDEAVSFLLCDGSMESAMYLDEEKKYDLVFPYMRHFSYAFAVNPEIRNSYLIGGGGFAYPKYYLSSTRNTKITVAEISQDVIDISHEYFGLREMNIEDYSRLRIIPSDGFAWLKETDEKFDLIINDAFLGNKDIGRHEEDTIQIHDHLNEKGIYLINVTSSLRGFGALKYRKYMKLLKKHFRYTSMIVAEEDRSPWEKQNLVMIASDRELL